MKKALFAAVAVSLVMPFGALAVTADVDAKADVRAEVKADLGARAEVREQFLEQNAAARAEFKAKMEANRTAMRTKMEEGRMKMATNLKLFKDQTKASTTARIAMNLNKVNENLTNMFARHLDKMSEILVRVEAKVGTSTTAEFTADVTAAKKAIAEADAAVAVQAGKTYNLTVTEATVKADVMAARDTLRKDLEAVKAKVEAAKTALREVLTNLPKPEAKVKAEGSVEAE